jgi:hypothetical protein
MLDMDHLKSQVPGGPLDLEELEEEPTDEEREELEELDEIDECGEPDELDELLELVGMECSLHLKRFRRKASARYRPAFCSRRRARLTSPMPRNASARTDLTIGASPP